MSKIAAYASNLLDLVNKNKCNYNEVKIGLGEIIRMAKAEDAPAPALPPLAPAKPVVATTKAK